MDDKLNLRLSLENLCATSLYIMGDYYTFNSIPNLKDFILPQSHEHNDSKVLFEETEYDFFIGVQFEHKIFDEIKNLHEKFANEKYISVNTAAVIAEEISHFKLLLDAIEKQKGISLIDLETLGEIDRFLCLMHWNEKSTIIQIDARWKNIHNICDFVFQGKRFKKNNPAIYIEAENRAFKHLKNAFAWEWDNTFYNFSKINRSAAQYFNRLREFFLL